MSTPLYLTFKKRVEDAISELIRRQVSPWIFMTAGPPFRVKMFNGQEIAYQGVHFDGTPRLVFWSPGYIKPFLEHLCVGEIDAALSSAREKRVDAKLLLAELQSLLSRGCGRVYGTMARVDWRLRGRGFPKTVKLRPVYEECQAMDKFITERVRAEVEMWIVAPRRFERWRQQLPLLVWVIQLVVGSGLGVGIITLCARYLPRLWALLTHHPNSGR